jgi:adenylate kinase family enzyme
VRAGISISLIVLIGPSGARKTTFARELVHTGALDVAAVIASDAVGA